MKKRKNKKFNLAFGFELECLMPRSSFLMALRQPYHCGDFQARFDKYLKFESDASLTINNNYAGIEIITRKYQLKDWEKIKTMFEKIKKEDIKIDETCGLHISFSARRLELQKIFLYSLLKNLREGLFSLVPDKQKTEYLGHYFRHYAAKINGYKDYKTMRDLEFNIRNNYIEWRGVHCCHLSEEKELLKKILAFIYAINKMIDKKVNLFLNSNIREENIEEIINNLHYDEYKNKEIVIIPKINENFLKNRRIYV